MKPIKQIFSAEIQEKVKKVGDYAFVVDKNDYVVKAHDNKHIFISKHKGAQHKLKQLDRSYNTKLHALLTQVAEMFSIDYSNQGIDGYTLYDAGTILVSFENLGSETTLNMPQTLMFIIDTTEDAPMFHKDTGIEAVVFNEALEVIGTHAFRELTGLQRVIFRQNLLKVKESAFDSCVNLDTILFPNTLKTIGNKAFHNTNISEVTIPYHIENIGAQAFAHTNADSLTVTLMAHPNNVTVAEDAFDTQDPNDLRIYVSDRYVDAYRDKLPQYYNNIHPASEMIDNEPPTI